MRINNESFDAAKRRSRLGSCVAGCVCSFAFLSTLAAFAQAPSPTPSPLPTLNAQTRILTDAMNAAQAAAPTPATLSSGELNSLVGPIALYPDPILIQVLAASTYPLEIVQLKQWLDKNKNLPSKELAGAVAKQNWDPSIQALAGYPAVVDKLANNIQWTTDLGNAFLAQENDVMDSVQNLRAKAQANGALRSNDKQEVGTEETQNGNKAITIESAQRDVVYVPTYNTEVVYRDSGYADDSSYSSGYSSSGYSSGSSDGDYSYIGYGVAAAYGYYWGRYNWRDGYGYTNRDNYYVKNYNSRYNSSSGNSLRNNANNISQRLSDSSGRWQHDPSHRGNAPYANNDLANRFGQPNNRLASSRGTSQLSQLSRANAPTQAARGNLVRTPAGARSAMRAPNAGAGNRIGNRAPSNFPGGAFSAPQGEFARASSFRGAESLSGFRGGPPDGFRGGPPGGLSAGGPPMGGGFRGGPPMGGGMPMGGGPPMGGGMPMGAPPPPPPHP